jgi:hypothetical protein
METVEFRNKEDWDRGQSFSNKSLDKFEVTRLLLWKQEWQMCETMSSSHRLCPSMVLVRVLLALTVSRVLWCRWRALLCTTTVFVSLFLDIVLKRLDEFRENTRISWKYKFFPFLGDLSEDTQEVTVESGGNFEDYIRFLSCHLFGPVNHGQIWKVEREVVKKAWLSRSMIIPLGTFRLSFPSLSLSVIHPKNQSKRFDFDNTINLSSLIINLPRRGRSFEHRQGLIYVTVLYYESMKRKLI